MLRADVSPHAAAERISAYVYGNILTLAALVVLHDDEIRTGAALAIVAGTAVSTFVAHAYAESLGGAVRGDADVSMRAVLRGSTPIVWSAAVPMLLMLAGSAEWFSATGCLRLAEAWVVGRLALTGFIVGRLRGLPVTIRTWVVSLALAAVALVIVGIKVVPDALSRRAAAAPTLTPGQRPAGQGPS
ncbi:MAG: hypothetical protein JWP31_1489 [Aeromicrobium sp.]|nr:hypothetical protein [Aeromicrobium sp.]